MEILIVFTFLVSSVMWWITMSWLIAIKDKLIVLEYLIRSIDNGIRSENECAASGCKNPAIYTIGICSDHAHPPRQ